MVLSLGLLLIGGTILLFVLVAKKIANPPSEDSVQVSVPREYRGCGEHALDLADGEALRDISYDGVIARLQVAQPDGGTQIRLVHLCSGKSLGHVTVRHRLVEFP